MVCTKIMDGSHSIVKVVICGKNKNLNKIIKITLRISLTMNRLLIFVVLYSFELKIVEHTA